MMLFYIGLSGNHAESSLATMRYLPQNIRFAGDGCSASHCGPNKEGQSVCQKFYKSKKVMSHQKREPYDHMCGGKMRWNCEEFLNPNKHRCHMKPIVNKEEDSSEAHS